MSCRLRLSSSTSSWPFSNSAIILLRILSIIIIGAAAAAAAAVHAVSSFVSLSRPLYGAAAARKPTTVAVVIGHAEIFKRHGDRKIMSLLGHHDHDHPLSAGQQQQQKQDTDSAGVVVVVVVVVPRIININTRTTASASKNYNNNNNEPFVVVQQKESEFSLVGTRSSSSTSTSKVSSSRSSSDNDNDNDPTSSSSSSSSRRIVSAMSQKSRRQWAGEVLSMLLAAAAAASTLLVAAPPRPAWSSMESDSSSSSNDILPLQQTSCQSGSLMAETAIPGAYEQVCMKLPIRIVPVTIPSLQQQQQQQTQTTVQLQIEQGSAAAGTTGLAVWNSSLLLSRLLSRLAITMSSSPSSSSSSSFLQNKKVLELGCGTGLVSLTAALLGASSVVATDGNPNVIALAQRNIQANRDKLLSSSSSSSSCDNNISARQLSWGLMDAMDYSETADWVIGSDLTYNAASWPLLAETMASVLVQNNKNNNNNNSFVLYLTLGHAGFNVNAEMDGFLTVAQEQGLQQVQPGDADWPFAANGGASGSSFSSLTSLLLQECIINNEERSIIAATGGARVVLLRSKNKAARR